MKVKELIEELKACNPDAIMVGDTSDHCYRQQLDFCGEGFAHINKYKQWVEFDEEEDTISKTPIVQIIFYS